MELLYNFVAKPILIKLLMLVTWESLDKTTAPIEQHEIVNNDQVVGNVTLPSRVARRCW